MFADLGLALDTFVVENLSLPDELQKLLDQRIGMNMIGDMDRYTQFQVAQSMPIAAANEGGGAAGIGVGTRRGMAMAQRMMNAMQAGAPGPAPPAPVLRRRRRPRRRRPAAEPHEVLHRTAASRFRGRAKFCPECGGAQQ